MIRTKANSSGTAIVDREHWEDPEIVETANGHRLDDLGLMRAASIIDQMKKDVVSMALGDELFLGHSEPEYAQPGILSTIATTAAELTAPLYDADSCKSCLENGTVCHHPQAN